MKRIKQDVDPLVIAAIKRELEIEDLKAWSKTTEPMPTLPPLKGEKRKKYYVSALLP